MAKLITISEDVYNRLKTYTNDYPHRSKKKVSFSEAITRLIDAEEKQRGKL